LHFFVQSRYLLGLLTTHRSWSGNRINVFLLTLVSAFDIQIVRNIKIMV